MKRVIILRGVSGSGKTTYAFRLAQGNDNVIVSTDYFFMKSGKFVYEASKIQEAHSETLKNFIEVVTAGKHSTIFVDNTNTSVAELAPYAAIATAYGYSVKIITLIVSPNVAAERSSHRVPIEVIRKQASTLESNNPHIPRRWEHEIIVEEASKEVA